MIPEDFFANFSEYVRIFGSGTMGALTSLMFFLGVEKLVWKLEQDD